MNSDFSLCKCGFAKTYGGLENNYSDLFFPRNGYRLAHGFIQRTALRLKSECLDTTRWSAYQL